MDFTTLIGVDDLRALIGRSDVVILDARFTLDDEQWGKEVYAEGHIPGAIQADTADHLAGEIIPGVTGRRPFPEPAVFAEQLGAWGIGDDTQVIAYDDMIEAKTMAEVRKRGTLRREGKTYVVADGDIIEFLFNV